MAYFESCIFFVPQMEYGAQHFPRKFWNHATGEHRLSCFPELRRASGVTKIVTVWPLPNCRMRKAPCEKSRKDVSYTWMSLQIKRGLNMLQSNRSAFLHRPKQTFKSVEAKNSNYLISFSFVWAILQQKLIEKWKKQKVLSLFMVNMALAPGGCLISMPVVWTWS